MAGLGRFLQTLVQSVLMAGPDNFLQSLVQSVLMAGLGKFLQTLVQSVLMAGPGRFLHTLVQSVLCAEMLHARSDIYCRLDLAGPGKFLQTLVQSVLMVGPGKFLQSLVQSVLCTGPENFLQVVVWLDWVFTAVSGLSGFYTGLASSCRLRHGQCCGLDLGGFCRFQSCYVVGWTRGVSADSSPVCLWAGPGKFLQPLVQSVLMAGPGKFLQSLVQSVLCTGPENFLQVVVWTYCQEEPLQQQDYGGAYGGKSPHEKHTWCSEDVNWPDTTEHIQPPALIKVKDAWEQDLKMFLNTVLVVLTDLAARLLDLPALWLGLDLRLRRFLRLPPLLLYPSFPRSLRPSPLQTRGGRCIVVYFLQTPGPAGECHRDCYESLIPEAGGNNGQPLLVLREGESKSECLKAGMLWRGYEVSEDVFLLCLCCLLLAEEMAVFGPYLSLGGISDAPLRILFLFCVLLLSLWIFLLFCILAYFPQFPTQLLGGALGCLSWRGLYQVFTVWGPAGTVLGGLEWDCSTPRPAVLKLNMHY
ncbi:hypothetical protein INR49_006531 [Caranx melampygus]|nr:hypothetical protein INR49_006531 [Caranx melampygus]